MATQVNPGKFAHTIKKALKPTTSQVDPHGVSQGKNGKGATFDSTIFKDGKTQPGPSPTDAGKKGSGAKLDLGSIKSLAKESITTNTISAAK